MEELLTRGVDHLIGREELEDALKSKKRTLRIKFGVDPTRPDLHIGHAVVLNKLRAFQELGHTVIFLIGDYTTKIGDPSGKSKTRPMLTDEEIAANVKTYLDQVGLTLDIKKAEVRYNSEWLGKLSFGELITLASHVSVAQIIEREDFKNRLASGQELALHELLYPLMQAYDSVALKADVEFGGNDQLFNLMTGRALQKKLGQRPQIVFTTELLVGTDGVQKMSKSLGNYVGVTDPPEEMFGKLMSIPDEAMDEYYRLLLGMERPQGPPNEAKRELGRRIVERFHGEGAGAAAEEHFNRVFVERSAPEEMPEVDLGEYRADGDGLVHLPRLIAGAFGVSSSEGRRLLQQGGVKLDGEPMAAEPLDREIDSLAGHVLQVGKRRFCRLRTTP